MEQKKRLGEMLIESGIIDDTQLQAALGHQRRWGMKLGQALLDLRLATEPQVVAALARKFGYEVAHLDAVHPGALLDAAIRLVPREVAAKHTLLPVAADTNTITVAMADPTNIAVVDELSFRTGRRVKICIAGERELAAAVRRLYFAEQGRRAPEPIAIDETDVPLETTRADDPFGALPDHLHEQYGVGAQHQPDPPAEYRSAVTPPPVLRPVAVAAVPPPLPTPSYRPAPPPPVAAPPLAQPAAYRPPPAVIASGPPAPAPPSAEVVDLSDLESPIDGRRLTPREVALADAIERLTRDAPDPGARAAALASALVRVLARKGLLSEVEFLDELSRK